VTRFLDSLCASRDLGHPWAWALIVAALERIF
jgi:hypothetical protein